MGRALKSYVVEKHGGCFFLAHIRHYKEMGHYWALRNMFVGDDYNILGTKLILSDLSSLTVAITVSGLTGKNKGKSNMVVSDPDVLCIMGQVQPDHLNWIDDSSQMVHADTCIRTRKEDI